jgi:uncharacterized protein
MAATQLALITGAFSGIGFELAKLFAQHSLRPRRRRRRRQHLRRASLLSQFSSEVRPVQVDLRTPDGVERLYRSTIEGDRVLTPRRSTPASDSAACFWKLSLPMT